MVGIPNKDINVWRDTFRNLYKDKEMTTGETYYLDIAHASLIRWTRKLSLFEIDKVLNILEFYNKNIGTVFASLDVNAIEVVNASWLLEESDVETLSKLKFINKSDEIEDNLKNLLTNE